MHTNVAATPPRWPTLPLLNYFLRPCVPQLLKILAIIDNQLVYSGILVSVFLYEEKQLAQNTFIYPESSIASSYTHCSLLCIRTANSTLNSAAY